MSGGHWHVYDGAGQLVAVVGDSKTLERLIGLTRVYFWQWVSD